MLDPSAPQPFQVLMGEDRFSKPIKFLNGQFDCKVSAKDTDGAWCAFDTFRTKPGGPPRHVHTGQDEWFMVLDGAFRFEVGDRRYEAGPGDTIFGPRGLPHVFASISPTARLMVLYQPALTMEEFFAAQLLNPISQEFVDLSRKHNMEVVGPPLQI